LRNINHLVLTLPFFALIACETAPPVSELGTVGDLGADISDNDEEGEVIEPVGLISVVPVIDFMTPQENTYHPNDKAHLAADEVFSVDGRMFKGESVVYEVLTDVDDLVAEDILSWCMLSEIRWDHTDVIPVDIGVIEGDEVVFDFEFEGDADRAPSFVLECMFGRVAEMVGVSASLVKIVTSDDAYIYYNGFNSLESEETRVVYVAP
jgi:hypothetical protein